MQECSTPPFEGWRNMPTFMVAHELQNIESLHKQCLQFARGVRKTVEIDTGTIQAAADAIRQFYKTERLRRQFEALPVYGSVGLLAQWALAYVDWREIAESYLRTAQEQEQARGT